MTEPQDLSWATKLVRDEFQLSESAITGVERVEGGLFNLLVRVATVDRTYIVKRFLNDAGAAGFKLPDIPPERRMMLSASVQRIAGASFRHASDRVLAPVVHRQDYGTGSMIMDAVSGAVTLQTELSKGEFPLSLCIDFPRAMAAFHADTTKRYDASDPLQNREIKALKLHLQYEQIAEQASRPAGRRIREELAAYSATQQCVVHGDLNSRNILLSGEVLAVVDFEQAHVGAPVFDVAYLLSELVTSYLYFRRPLQKQRIESFLDCYARSGPPLDPGSLATHTATQILYRFWGPSREVWTSYIPEQTAIQIVQVCEASLSGSQSTIAELMG